MSNQEQISYNFGPFRLSPQERQLYRDDQPIHLEPKHLNTLLLLVQAKGNLVTKERLIKEVWQGEGGVDNRLNQAISRLRRVLGEYNTFIETKHTEGFRFVGRVEEVSSTTQVSGDEVSSVPPPTSRMRDKVPHASVEPSKSPTQRSDDSTGNENSADTSTAEYKADQVLPTSRRTDDGAPRIVWIWIAIIGLFLVLSQRSIITKAAIPLQILCILGAFIALALLFRQGPKQFVSNDKKLITKEDEVMKVSGYENRPDDWNTAKTIAIRALKGFKNHWYWLLGTWGLFYIVLSLRPHSSDEQVALSQALHSVNPESLTLAFSRQSPEVASAITSAVSSVLEGQQTMSLGVAASRIFATLCNNLNSLILIFGYIILSKPGNITGGTSNNRGKGYINKVRGHINRAPLPWGIPLVISIALIEVAWVYSSSNAVKQADILELFDWITGIVGGSALAIYVGRLQSKFLKPPRSFLIVAFYCYAAIQPLYPLVNLYPYKYERVAAGILYAALLLKGLLISYVVQLVQSGRLLFYFVRVTSTDQMVDDNWKDFQLLLE